MKTQEQKDAMIKALGLQRNELPEFSVFGTPNWEAIDAKIDVIENELGDDEIMTKYPYDEDLEENHVNSEAMDAHEWLSGDLDDEDMVDEDHLKA